MRQCRKLFHIQCKVENQIQVKGVNSVNLFMQETVGTATVTILLTVSSMMVGFQNIFYFLHYNFL